MGMKTTALLLIVAVGIAASMNSHAHAQTPRDTRSMPTIDQILERYIQALGGRAAFEKLTTRVSKGTFENQTRGIRSGVAVYAQAPNLRVQVMGGVREVSRGFNGTTGWSKNFTETGFRELTGDELDAERREDDFYREIRLKELHPSMNVTGTTMIGTREAYVVDAGGADRSERFYFDAASGLLLKRDTITQTPRDGVIPIVEMLSIPTEVYFEDYKDVEGVTLPHTLRRIIGRRNTTVTTFAEIAHNVPIDAKTFEKPVN